MHIISGTTLEPNVDDILRHLALLFDWTRDECSDVRFEVRCLSPQSKPAFYELFRCTDEGYGLATKFARDANRDGYNVYVTANPLRAGVTGSAKDEDVEIALHHFIDHDGIDDPEQLIENRNCGFDPAFRVISGSTPLPRMHTYWRMAEPIRSMDQWRQTQRDLAVAFGSDPAVINPARILRLAGSVSYPDQRKVAKGYISEIVRLADQGGPTVDPSAFAGAFHQEPAINMPEPDWRLDNIGGAVPLEVIEAAYAAIPPVSTPGRRNVWLEIAHATKAANPGARSLFETWQRQSPLYSAKDAHLWDTIHPSAGSFAGLFRHARQENPDWWRDRPAVAAWWRERAASHGAALQHCPTRSAAEIIIDLAARHGSGEVVTADMCVRNLGSDPAEVRKVKEYAARAMNVSATEFNGAMHRKKIVDTLGGLPGTASEFVRSAAARDQIVCLYNGTLARNGHPADSIGFSDLQRDMRVLADELRLGKRGIGHPQINDASEKWYREAQRLRRQEVVDRVEWHGNVERQQQARSDLLALVTKCFDCAEGPEFAAAVILKFIHQVKRKMQGLRVFDHLMLVILNPRQGIGKSSFVERLISPVSEVSLPSDFKQITDDRNIQIWRSYVLYLEEMGWASKADIDMVKHIITANTLPRRPMRSNNVEEVTQNATLIGSANAMAISDFVRDPTGMRRFVGLTMHDKPDWDTINTMDWIGLWQSVDPASEDPMLLFKSILVGKQDADRDQTPVELWQAQISPHCFLFKAAQCRELFTREELFAEFRDYEERHFPRSDTNLNKFSRELGRVARQFPETARFQPTRDGNTRMWRWVGGDTGSAA